MVFLAWQDGQRAGPRESALVALNVDFVRSPMRCVALLVLAPEAAPGTVLADLVSVEQLKQLARGGELQLTASAKIAECSPLASSKHRADGVVLVVFASADMIAKAEARPGPKAIVVVPWTEFDTVACAEAHPPILVNP
jgi:hypothetical protein